MVNTLKQDCIVGILGLWIYQESTFARKQSYTFIFFGKSVKNHIVITKCHLNYSKLKSFDKNINEMHISILW